MKCGDIVLRSLIATRTAQHIVEGRVRSTNNRMTALQRRKFALKYARRRTHAVGFRESFTLGSHQVTQQSTPSILNALDAGCGGHVKRILLIRFSFCMGATSVHDSRKGFRRIDRCVWL